jgi:hypothetical protein
LGLESDESDDGLTVTLMGALGLPLAATVCFGLLIALAGTVEDEEAGTATTAGGELGVGGGRGGFRLIDGSFDGCTAVKADPFEAISG